MQKINRLVWAEGTCIESYSVKVGIRVNQPEQLEHLVPFLPPDWKPIEPPRRLDALYSWVVGGERRPNVRTFDVLYSDAARVARTRQRNDFLELFEGDLRLKVALLSRRFVFIHAGAVGWQGRAILIPGRTFTGKSTLVEALVRAGAEYLSDEYAVLDRNGRVHPFAKPITLRSGDPFVQTPVALADIRGRIARHPMKVSTILATTYKKGARWRFRRASPGQGVLALLGSAVAARWAPSRVLGATCKVAASALILRGTRGEAQDTVEQLLDIVNNPGQLYQPGFQRGGLYGSTREFELAAESEARRLAN